MLLAPKNVLVFAASGAIGSEVAHAFAREGARMWISGRNAAALHDLAHNTAPNGQDVMVDVVDATNPEAVTAYVDRVARTAGRIDATFNGIGLPPRELGYPADSTIQDLDLFSSRCTSSTQC